MLEILKEYAKKCQQFLVQFALWMILKVSATQFRKVFVEFCCLQRDSSTPNTNLFLGDMKEVQRLAKLVDFNSHDKKGISLPLIMAVYEGNIRTMK